MDEENETQKTEKPDEIIQDLILNREESYKTPEPSSRDSTTCKSESLAETEKTILKADFLSELNRTPPELTLAMIKPDGMKHLKKINKIIRNEGYNIIQERFVHLTPEQASNFYYEHYGETYFPYLIATMCEGPIKVYVLRKKDAVTQWKLLCGPACVEEAKKKWPNSLRAIFGMTGKGSRNVCHGSDSKEKALEEIRFFFPNMILEPNLIDEVKIEDYLKEFVNPTLLEGLTQLCKNKPVDPILWMANWLLMNNPFKPKMPERITLTPT